MSGAGRRRGGGKRARAAGAAKKKRRRAQAGARVSAPASPRPIGWRGDSRRREPAREPFVFGPRNHPTPVEPLKAAPPEPASYDYGFPAPEPRNAWQDEGGEGPAAS